MFKIVITFICLEPFLEFIVYFLWLILNLELFRN